MAIKDLLGKLFGGKGNVIGEAGLNAIIQGLQQLGSSAEGDDKTSITDIIGVIKKAIDSKGDLSKIIEKCLPIAQKIGNIDLKEAVLKLLKK